MRCDGRGVQMRRPNKPMILNHTWLLSDNGDDDDDDDYNDDDDDDDDDNDDDDNGDDYNGDDDDDDDCKLSDKSDKGNFDACQTRDLTLFCARKSAGLPE